MSCVGLVELATQVKMDRALKFVIIEVYHSVDLQTNWSFSLRILAVQYLVKRYVGVWAVTSTTGGLHISQPFHPTRLRGVGR